MTNSGLDGLHSAAILLLGMGEKNAAEVLKHLEPRQVQKVGMTMSTITGVNKNQIQQVFLDFLNVMEDQTSLTVDSDQYIRTVLIEALGEERANPFIDRILVSDKDYGLNRLKWLDGRMIADLIRNEHPQIIATILIHLDSEQAAEVVKFLAAEKRDEVMLRMCTIDAVKPEAISQLGEVIEKQLAGQKLGKAASIGGIKNVADVINFLDGSIESEIMDKIKEWDPELYEKIRDKMFVFENLLEMDDRSLQTLLRDVTSEQLLLALKGTTDPVKEKVFQNMSKRAADLLKDDLSAKGPVKVVEVEHAQKAVINLARRLSEEGKISLGARGGEEMI